MLKIFFIINKIQTARDFGILFNAYVKFEEEMLKLITNEDEVLIFLKFDIVLYKINKF